MNDQRKPKGRPQLESMFRFNVSTNLTASRKFIRFRRALSVSELEAYGYLTRFWSFIAANYAYRPKLSADDADLLAEHCWFSGAPETLIAALQTAGFLEGDLRVHDWFDHQPLALKIVNEREFSHEISADKAISVAKNGTNKREEKSKAIPPAPLPEHDGQWRSVPERVLRNRNGHAISSREAVRQVMTRIPAPGSAVSQADPICREFCDRYGYSDPHQCESLRVRIVRCGELHGFDCVRRMIADINEDKAVREPIAVLHHKLNQALGASQGTDDTATGEKRE